ncbi:hypothetical protein ACTS9C_00860 [Empedobacter brevis]
MNEIIKTISIILFIVLLTYGFFSFIKKISNNYKVLLLPIITLLNSVFFGYKAFKTSDDIILIIWMSIFLFSILIIVSVLNRVYKINHRKHKPLENIINKTNINHNFQTNIDTIDNSKTFQNSQTNNHLKQINNVTNIHSKQSSQKKEKVDVMNSSENTNIKLSEEQLRKVYFFFIDNELLADYDLEFINFKDLFLKEQIRLKADVPTLRQLYNNLKIQKNIKFNNITNDFLIYFINSNDDQIYDYKQFTKDPKPTSGLNEEIKKLFKDF